MATGSSRSNWRAGLRGYEQPQLSVGLSTPPTAAAAAAAAKWKLAASRISGRQSAPRDTASLYTQLFPGRRVRCGASDINETGFGHFSPGVTPGHFLHGYDYVNVKNKLSYREEAVRLLHNNIGELKISILKSGSYTKAV